MKKIISVFLIFALVVLITPVTAKEKRGAELVVLKRDGMQIRGELITVKENSLLLLSPEGEDVTIRIEENLFEEKPRYERKKVNGELKLTKMDSELDKILEKLRKKDRIPDYN